MDTIQVVYNGEGNVMLCLDGSGLVLSREEAEALFVDLGHCLQDMDMMANSQEMEQ